MNPVFIHIETKPVKLEKNRIVFLSVLKDNQSKVFGFIDKNEPIPHYDKSTHRYGDFMALAPRLYPLLHDSWICCYGNLKYLSDLVSKFRKEWTETPILDGVPIDLEMLVKSEHSEFTSLQQACLYYAKYSFDPQNRIEAVRAIEHVIRGVCREHGIKARTELYARLRAITRQIDSAGFFVFRGGVPYCSKGLFSGTRMAEVPTWYYSLIAEKPELPEDVRNISRSAMSGIYPVRKYK